MPQQNDSDQSINALIAEITAAFDGVARDHGTTLHEALAIDDRKTVAEQQAARLLDTEKRWQDVPGEDLRACGVVLAFMDARGFRYYLPAFMVYELKTWDDVNGIDSCEFHLLHEHAKSLRQSEPASIAAKYHLDEAQCRAIAHYLRFVIGADDELTTQEAPVLRAVDKWEQFVGERDSVGNLAS